MSAPAFTVDIGNTSVGVVDWRGPVPLFARYGMPEDAAAACKGRTVLISVAESRRLRFREGLGGADRDDLMELRRAPPGLGPEQLLASAGRDRVAAVIAVRPGPAVVVNAGTAVTVEVVGRGGAWLGGFIAAGPRTMARGLSAATTGLPDRDVVAGPLSPGASTAAALDAGIWGMAVGGVDRLVEEARRYLAAAGCHEIRVVATGGWGAAWVAATGHSRAEFSEILVHRGIRAWALGGAECE